MPVILLVEDDEPIQDFVRGVLGNAGVDLTVSSSAEEALVVLASGVVRFRGLVTDIRIEGELGGWELARRFGKSNRAFQWSTSRARPLISGILKASRAAFSCRSPSQLPSSSRQYPGC